MITSARHADAARVGTSFRVPVRCGGTERVVEFRHVPPGGRRTATITCPAGSDPTALVGAWVAA